MKNFIDLTTCKSCKSCIAVCPVNLLDINDKKEVFFIPERESICLKCGQCMAVCSTDSVHIEGYSYDKNFYKLPENPVNMTAFNQLLAHRRTIRNYKDKEVTKEVIEDLLETLSYAPYGASPQKVEITVVNNRAFIEKQLPIIEKFLDDIIKWVDSPIVSRIIKKKKGIETFNTLKNHLYPMSKLGNYKLKYGDRISRDAPALMIFHADKSSEEHTNNALIYSTYVMLALTARGLGGGMNGIIPAAINKVAQLKKNFGIPEEHEAINSIIFGYPKYHYKKAIKREPKIVHWIEENA